MESLSQLHPWVVHYPIALFVIYALLETIGALFKKDFFSKSALLILFLGMLGAVAAVLTGNSAEAVVQHMNNIKVLVPIDAVSDHVDYANFTLWYFAGILVLRTFIVLNKKFFGGIQYIFVILSLIGVFLVFKTGEYGGRLVYKFGAGTEYIKKGIKNPPGDKLIKGIKGKQE